MFDPISADAIPPGLDDMEPGPELAAYLSSIDVSRVSGYDRVVVMRAHQRMASHYAAHVYRDMAAVTAATQALGAGPHEAPGFAEAEIRAALTLTRRTAENELAVALDLERRLPAVRRALESGAIDPRRARVVISGTAHLPPAAAREVAEGVLDDAPRLTTGTLAARVRRLCIDHDPADAVGRYENAEAGRRVVSYPTPEGTTNLTGMDLPPDRAAAAMERINRIARSLRRDGESRTMDQLRADVFLDLIEGAGPATGHARGTVDIRVDLTTLAGLAESAAEIPGYGPVVADIARRVADRQHRSEWRYVVTDPETGDIVATGVTSRRPTARLRREVEATYQTCVFPGCRMPAAGCDLDHRVPWAQGGPTTSRHLAPCCRHDHVIRHSAGWSYRRLPNHNHEWTSPFGHTYTAQPQPP